MDMCRFEDENDDGYVKFRGVLARFIAEIGSEHPSLMEASLGTDAARRAGQSSSGTWSDPSVTGRSKDTG